ncbi:hypothetical protein [Desertivirga brevis]|uniref:hypothetical protein n=1 Tax=Desertivirga brevis TaxID=2810310 RepID=UPI001A96DC08|nr:hypothetical protein [Pedobacter sp. SYSU D00873]
MEGRTLEITTTSDQSDCALAQSSGKNCLGNRTRAEGRCLSWFAKRRACAKQGQSTVWLTRQFVRRHARKELLAKARALRLVAVLATIILPLKAEKYKDKNSRDKKHQLFNK